MSNQNVSMSAGHFPGARGFSSLFPNEIEQRSEGKEPQRSKKQESKREKKKSLWDTWAKPKGTNLQALWGTSM